MWRMVLVLIFCGLLGSCKITEFSRGNGQKKGADDNKSTPQDPSQGDSQTPAKDSTPFKYDPSKGHNPNQTFPGGNSNNFGTDGSGNTNNGVDTEDGTIIPKECVIGAIEFAAGVTKCPEDYAAYAIDDADTAHLACCPLPAEDILLRGATKQISRTCPANFVATGVTGNQLECTQINTQKYQLAPAQVCYYGSGDSGGDGSSSCGATPGTIQAMTTRFGSDSCIGFPFGSLITRYEDKYCRDMSAVELLTIQGQKIPMYK